MANDNQHRHDISDEVWEILKPILPGQRGQWGGIDKDNRLFINAVFWIFRTGAAGRVIYTGAPFDNNPNDPTRPRYWGVI